MIDPKLVLVLLAIMAMVWVGEQTVKGVKYVGHKTKCGAMHIVGKSCEPKTP